MKRRATIPCGCRRPRCSWRVEYPPCRWFLARLAAGAARGTRKAVEAAMAEIGAVMSTTPRREPIWRSASGRAWCGMGMSSDKRPAQPVFTEFATSLQMALAGRRLRHRHRQRRRMTRSCVVETRSARMYSRTASQAIVISALLQVTRRKPSDQLARTCLRRDCAECCRKMGHDRTGPVSFASFDLRDRAASAATRATCWDRVRRAPVGRSPAVCPVAPSRGRCG